ncbi:hypothetical protein JRQ81_008015, partial [Phrynocephalus forsythii]
MATDPPVRISTSSNGAENCHQAMPRVSSRYPCCALVASTALVLNASIHGVRSHTSPTHTRPTNATEWPNLPPRPSASTSDTMADHTFIHQILARISLPDICKAATWSTPSTFLAHYKFDVRAQADAAFGRASSPCLCCNIPPP